MGTENVHFGVSCKNVFELKWKEEKKHNISEPITTFTFHGTNREKHKHTYTHVLELNQWKQMQIMLNWVSVHILNIKLRLEPSCRHWNIVVLITIHAPQLTEKCYVISFFFVIGAIHIMLDFAVEKNRRNVESLVNDDNDDDNNNVNKPK